MSPTVRSDTRTVTIDVPPAETIAFLADPFNLPLWAVGFCRSIRADRDRFIVSTANGDVPIKMATNADTGVVDFIMEISPGVEATAFSRVIPNGSGSEYLFTQLQSPGMPD